LVFILLPSFGEATVVRLITTQGPIDINLYDTQAPQTVDNFLNYVNRGDYDNTFFHRSVPGFIIQGGGFGIDETTGAINQVETDPAVVNEFSVDRSNLRGTIAMAKLSDAPDSATSQWFINLADNLFLNSSNGGFTVFGTVMGQGMDVVDALADLPVVNAGGTFSDLPLLSVPDSGQVSPADLVMISSFAILPTTEASTSDRLFNFLEASYPQFISPANAISATIEGYYYRYYPLTNSYIATRENQVYYLGPATGNTITPLGSFDVWYNQAVTAGY
ncbi:MAG: peptidylprolyl isomerase, partial [Thermodesulfobacteriota bacterium]|nr:peptidylprolyl isomerase [Thermodesulfobacteriota bacterium]